MTDNTHATPEDHMPDDDTFNAAEAIASILDAAGATAVRQLRVGRWAVLVVAINGAPWIVTVQPA